MNLAKIGKYIEYVTTKIKVMYKERKIESNGYQLKYMLEKNESDTLIVILSGIPRPGLKARYNYNRTLRNIKANKLFILDDFGYDERGAYYLGKDRDFKIQLVVKDLIKKTKYSLNIKNTIYCGSSKGGYASMYFGLQDDTSTIIAGSFQYFLGKYITKNMRLSENTMSFIMGKDYTNDDIEYLDNLLKGIIIRNKNSENKIYLHYSDSEYTYNDYMKYLLVDLNENGLKYEENIEHYLNHDEIALFFPKYLLQTINKVMQENKKRIS